MQKMLGLVRNAKGTLGHYGGDATSLTEFVAQSPI